MLRLYTDGSFSPESGVGSWAWLLADASCRGLGSGTVPAGATHQRMELVAVIEGLGAVPEGAAVEVVSDSAQLVEAMNRGYPERWRRRGWISIGHDRAIAHPDLWRALERAVARRRVRFMWVKAHGGQASDPWNVMADHMAKTARLLAEAAA